MSGIEVTGPRPGGTLIFVVDLSMSVREQAEEVAPKLLARAIESKSPTDKIGLVSFAERSVLEAAPNDLPTFEGFEAALDPGETDIEAALIRAIAGFTDSGPRRLILISDGVETTGDASRAAEVASSLGIPIDVVQLPAGNSANEVALTGVRTPKLVNLGQTHEMTLFVHSTTIGEASLYILRNGDFYGQDRLELIPGENTFTYSTLADSRGVQIYDFLIESQSDNTPDNNVYRVPLFAQGEPSLIYVHNAQEFSSSLVAALEGQGIGVTAVTADRFTSSLSELLSYDAIIFDNVPAFDFSFARMQLIERYVRDLGGGFLMIGGDSSFGVGGYLDTPIERVLPVDMDVTSSMDIPSLALIMVVDKSGSMGETIASGVTKLDLVKEAVIASVEVLNPYYTVGLLAFDADSEWTIPPTSAGDREKIVADLSGLASGGGTKLFPAIETALEEFLEIQASVKHMLILSDGLTDGSDLGLDPGLGRGLVTEIANRRITVSTIAVGSDANVELLEEIAELGGGRSYYTDDIEAVPRMFASESIIVSRGLVMEERFIPRLDSPSEILDGIDQNTLPPLGGSVLAYTKPAASQVLTSFDANPLLAAWRFGLGRSAAFTSSLSDRWGAEWLDWDDFPRFAAQLVRWLQRPPESSQFEVDLAIDQNRGSVTVDAIDGEGNFINGLELDATLLFPEGSTETIPLEQRLPGRYRAEFPARGVGDYYVSINSPDDSARAIYGTSVPYALEHLPQPPDSRNLEKIAGATGGFIITETFDFERLFTAAQGEREGLPAWPAIVFLSLILFLVDVVFRQIAYRTRESGGEGGLRNWITPRSEIDDYSETIARIERSYRSERAQHETGFWFGSDRRAGNSRKVVSPIDKRRKR